MAALLSIDVGTAILAITPLLFTAIPRPATQAAPDKAPFEAPFVRAVLSDLRDGLHFVWRWNGLKVMIALFMLLNLLAWPLTTLIPILVTRHFAGGAFELAWMQSGLGAGAILGGAILSVWGGFRQRVTTMMLALILMGIAAMAAGLTPATAFLLAVVAWSFVGVMSSTVNATSMAILQATVPPDVQGRVFALNWSCVTAMSPIGLAIAGPLVDALNPQFWYMLSGAVLTAAGLGACFVPALMHIEDQRMKPVASGLTSPTSRQREAP
jgi:DHA3 family macrolide efflux protein-like MFS transporter